MALATWKAAAPPVLVALSTAAVDEGVSAGGVVTVARVVVDTIEDPWWWSSSWSVSWPWSWSSSWSVSWSVSWPWSGGRVVAAPAAPVFLGPSQCLV
jgi:hypothetical protein